PAQGRSTLPLSLSLSSSLSLSLALSLSLSFPPCLSLLFLSFSHLILSLFSPLSLSPPLLPLWPVSSRYCSSQNSPLRPEAFLSVHLLRHLCLVPSASTHLPPIPVLSLYPPLALSLSPSLSCSPTLSLPLSL